MPRPVRDALAVLRRVERQRPLPPSSAPNAFRIIVMGCMGNSLATSWALTETMPQGASLPESLAHGRVLDPNLLARVQDEVQVLCRSVLLIDSFGNHRDNTASSLSVARRASVPQQVLRSPA